MQSPCQKLWNDVRRVLRGMVSAEIFNLWFASLKARSLNGEEIVVEAGNEFHELWLTNNYRSLIQEILKHHTGREMAVRFTVRPGGADAVEPAPSMAAPVPVAPAAPPPPSPKPRESGPLVSGLNPNYTFETFVVGQNASFAHAAALSVAQAPGKTWNPLFLYGRTGLGKTHLLHAVGHHVGQERRNARIVYVTTERFTNEFIEGIRNNDLSRFRRKYRNVDMLLIDDIHFLQKKDRIQEEFFHTFNALHEAHRQIVLTSDRPVGEIEGLEQRLVSRFEWGLLADLQPPDVETRLAILRKKQAQYKLDLPEPVLEFMAERFRSNVRRLEGALAKLGATLALSRKPREAIGIELAEQILREQLLEESRHVVTVDMIQQCVSTHYDVRLADMTSRRRPEHIAFARQVAMYLTRKLTSLSLSAIGEAFGGRDHGTVLHASRLVAGRMEVDPNVRQTVELLERQLQV